MRIKTMKRKGLTSGRPSLITCTTFNILAPIYKRLNHNGNRVHDSNSRESDYRMFWMSRNRKILDALLRERSSIICLQEFWMENEELVSMYDKRLDRAGYVNFKLARTNNRGDGLLTAVHKDCLRVINYQELLFNDCGDRVAQLLHVELFSDFSHSLNSDTRQEILIVNTHLLFPHDSSLCIVRLHQVYKILQCIDSYQKEHKLNTLPVILCGDWNGSKRGHVYMLLRSLGFVSSYDTAHQYTDADAKWISHRNHRGNICGVDFIWLLNPNMYSDLLKMSWSDAVLSMLRYLLKRAKRTEDEAFAFLKDSNSDCISYSSFCEALRQLKLTGHCHGLGVEEIKDLWLKTDIDGDGSIDYKEFQKRIWNPVLPDKSDGNGSEEEESLFVDKQQTIGFSVDNAVLFPPEAERGRWPENYSLSDHAILMVVFAPVRMPCSRLKSP